MEIQTFILCKSLSRESSSHNFNAESIALHTFYSLDGAFPLKFSMPFYMLLRREQRKGDEPISLRFNLIDTDGRSCGAPLNVLSHHVFPDGHMFSSLHGSIKFEFPKVGDYRLDITADENKLASVYNYNIEIIENHKR